MLAKTGFADYFCRVLAMPGKLKVESTPYRAVLRQFLAAPA